jgi:hypothetical protein
MGQQDHTVLADQGDDSLRLVAKQSIARHALVELANASIVDHFAIASLNDIAHCCSIAVEGFQVDEVPDVCLNDEDVTFRSHPCVRWIGVDASQVCWQKQFHGSIISDLCIWIRLAKACVGISEWETWATFGANRHALIGQDTSHPSLVAASMSDCFSTRSTQQPPAPWRTTSA